MSVVQYEQPAPLPPTTPTDELAPGPLGWVARLRAAAEIANYIGATDFVPAALRDNPAAIAAAILYGQEVGLEPMQALAKIAVIKGKPTLTAEAQRALVVAAGHEIWFEESTTTRAIAAGRRRGEDRIGRVTWTMDDAKRAGLAGQPNFRSYPAEMLRARASAALARAMFPDAIGGLPAAEELEGDPDNGIAPAALPPAPDDVQPAPAPARTRRRARRATPTPAAEPAAQPLPPTPPPDDQPEPPAEPDRTGEPPATDAQKRQVFALMRDLGIDERQERLDVTAEAIGRAIDSSSALTIGEASLLIDALIARRDQQPEPGPGAAEGADEPAGPPDEPEPVPYNEFPPGY